ncbi:nitroreductase family protein [Silvibacterium acidisoli]|uniref:nitroreductase family protein n=1 Tax=Acidobacteriaceae bacterium ZG23-2 TaxID=2883246 RepID=UPI00406C0F05
MSEKQDSLERLKHAPSIEGVPDILFQRWSPRALATTPVSAENLKKIFEAASWAASSYNEQPWRFLVGHKGDETYKKIYESLAEPNQQWNVNTPVLILSAGKKTFTQNGSPNPYQLHDTGAATTYLSLAATALGMHSHSMGGFDRDKARSLFSIPDDFELGAVTALGYLGDPETLPEHFKKMELAPRQRKPLDQFVFTGWDKPATF